MKMLAVVIACFGIAVPAGASGITGIVQEVGTIHPNSDLICDGSGNCGGLLAGSYVNFTSTLPGVYTAIPGNSGSQIAVTPGNIATLDLSRFGKINEFSFDWGWITPGMLWTIEVSSFGATISFPGSFALESARLNTNSSHGTFTFIPDEPTQFGKASFISFASGPDQAAFIFDNFRVVPSTSGAVPEPASWAMLIFGFGLVGVILRRGRKPTAMLE